MLPYFFIWRGWYRCCKWYSISCHQLIPTHHELLLEDKIFGKSLICTYTKMPQTYKYKIKARMTLHLPDEQQLNCNCNLFHPFVFHRVMRPLCGKHFFFGVQSNLWTHVLAHIIEFLEITDISHLSARTFVVNISVSVSSLVFALVFLADFKLTQFYVS